MKKEEEKNHKIIHQQQEIESKKITIKKNEDEKKDGHKRNPSIEIGRDGKSVRMGQSFSKTVYEWNKPKKM